jgi:hypothetical protein
MCTEYCAIAGTSEGFLKGSRRAEITNGHEARLVPVPRMFAVDADTRLNSRLDDRSMDNERSTHMLG